MTHTPAGFMLQPAVLLAVFPLVTPVSDNLSNPLGDSPIPQPLIPGELKSHSPFNRLSLC